MFSVYIALGCALVLETLIYVRKLRWQAKVRVVRDILERHPAQWVRYSDIAPIFNFPEGTVQEVLIELAYRGDLDVTIIEEAQFDDPVEVHYLTRYFIEKRDFSHLKFLYVGEDEEEEEEE